jgi:putative ABC transport system permease protein
MLKNYLKTALRNLSRNLFFSIVNILGLSAGLACCMLIILYTRDEVSYDGFHQNKDNIYRVTADIVSPGGEINKSSSTGMMPGPAFEESVPEIEKFVRIQGTSFNIKHGNDVFEQEALYADSSFFSVFSFPLVAGDRATALRDIHHVVLSEEVAVKYFGKKDAVGETLELNTGEKFEPFVVSAVTKRTPQNSSIKINMLVPLQLNQSSWNNHQWVNFFLKTFVVLRPGADPRVVEAKFADVFRTKAADELREIGKKRGFKSNVKFGLQPLTRMHLSTDYPPGRGLADASSPVYAYILTGIALFILVIACINFVNLTIAHSLRRAKEIGVRKVIGGLRGQLVLQFLGESFILSFIAFLLSILLVQMALPLFNTLANKALSFTYLLDAKLIAGYIALFLLTGLLAGFYPALVLSGFNPVQTLYGRIGLSGKGRLSKGLVVTQFALAAFLITATVIIYEQFNYMTNYDLGYNDKNVVVLSLDNGDLMSKFQRAGGQAKTDQLGAFRNELLKDPSIENVTADQGDNREGTAIINTGEKITFAFMNVDENFLPLLQIPLEKGRNFSGTTASDTAQSVIINQAFARAAGWRDPLGRQVALDVNKKYTVIGIIKDYHYASLAEKIMPQLFLMNPANAFGTAYIKIKPGNPALALAHIENTFKNIFPNRPYQFDFKEGQNAAQYEKEARWKQIITCSGVLTIFISCIGLFGLAMLTARKQAREIGIRKVLGASVLTIAWKLSADFLKLVILSLAIALPCAWWTMHRWLQNYPYRIGISWWMLGTVAIFVLLIAWLTVSYQSTRAALANPVKSLRME